METVKIEAKGRSVSGKGAARRLRAEQQIPAVFYGRGIESRGLSLNPKTLRAALGGEYGKNVLMDLEIDGAAATRVQMVDYQVHPVSRALLHVDFRKVEDDVAVNVMVPLVFEGKAKGIVSGGRLRQVFREIPVRCLPSQIPATVVHDVTPLEIDDTVRVRDLQLAEGLTVRYPAEQTLGGVYGSKARPEGEDGDAEGEEKKEGEEA